MKNQTIKQTLFLFCMNEKVINPSSCAWFERVTTDLAQTNQHVVLKSEREQTCQVMRTVNENYGTIDDPDISYRTFDKTGPNPNPEWCYLLKARVCESINR